MHICIAVCMWACMDYRRVILCVDVLCVGVTGKRVLFSIGVQR